MQMTLGDLLRLNADRYPSREAVAFEDGRATFVHLDRRSNRRANAFLKAGVKRGDHVAILGSNSMELIEAFFGLWRIGAVPVPLNTRLSVDELAYIVNHSDASTVLFLKAYETIIMHLARELRKVKMFLCTGGACTKPFVDIDSETLLQTEMPPPIEVTEVDVATIIYTAGTTGKPKGAMATHRNWVWGIVNILMATWSYAAHPLKVLSANPFFHVGGFINLFWSIFNGGSLYIMKKFDPREMLTRIEQEGIERVQGPSTIYKMLLLVPDIANFDLSSVRVVGSGAETMPDQTRKNVKQLFPNAGIWEVYGMTEAGGIITVRSENHTASKPFSVGQANLFEDVRVVDEQGNPVPPGEIGEIIVRGPHIMQGYYKDPARNQEALRDGWFYTQDLGRFDEDAFLYVIERKHNMIISGGENIYPKEVEDLLFRHPAVADAAVFGLPDSLWGHRVCAAIVAKKGAQLTEGDVIDFCKGKLAGYKKPRSVFFVESLPRNAVGKVLRSELKELFCNV